MAEVVGVKFKEVGKVYFFSPDSKKFNKGDMVIVETARGIEYGSVVVGLKQVSEEEIVPPLKKVIRVSTPEDDAHVAANAEYEKEAFQFGCGAAGFGQCGSSNDSCDLFRCYG